MPISEQVYSAGDENLKQQKQQKRSYENIERPEETNDYQLSMTIYKQIEREKRKKILKRVEDIEKRYRLASQQENYKNWI
ncbi:MAG: hypothetical protein LBU02_02005 [Rickettsiales bacterium]|jgi:hypothetical protein|nr:hypothetical protein [Rickettsiales bacterium]